MTTTATHLRTCAMHWTDLRDALSPPAIHHGFGIGLRGHLAALEEADEQEARLQAAHLRALERDPIQIGARPVPVRLVILDTMNTVETALIACADDIARQVQRQPIAAPTARRTATHPYLTQREADIAHADRQRRTQLAHADLVDPRRWRYTGRRTAPYAALWLLARIERAPGPCRRLDEEQVRHIARTAETAAGRVETALDIAAQRKTLARPCACGGAIDVHGGEGKLPVAHCTGCGRIWAEGVIAA